jgi:hypothetical protein
MKEILQRSPWRWFMNGFNGLANGLCGIFNFRSESDPFIRRIEDNIRRRAEMTPEKAALDEAREDAEAIRSDWDAIISDWEAVEGDLRWAIDKMYNELPQDDKDRLDEMSVKRELLRINRRIRNRKRRRMAV